MCLCVSLFCKTEKDLTLNVCLGGEDYGLVEQLVLTFNADSSSTNYIEVTLFDDNTTEDTETFSVVASSSDPSVSFSVNETVISIIDNDSKDYSLL